MIKLKWFKIYPSFSDRLDIKANFKNTTFNIKLALLN